MKITSNDVNIMALLPTSARKNYMFNNETFPFKLNMMIDRRTTSDFIRRGTGFSGDTMKFNAVVKVRYLFLTYKRYKLFCDSSLHY